MPYSVQNENESKETNSGEKQSFILSQFYVGCFGDRLFWKEDRGGLMCPTLHYNFPLRGHKGPKDRVQVQNRAIDLIPTIFWKDITAWICQNLATKQL